jgi:hypothetical protein
MREEILQFQHKKTSKSRGIKEFGKSNKEKTPQRHISYPVPLLPLPFSPALLFGRPPSAGTAKYPPNPFPTITLLLTPPPF